MARYSRIVYSFTLFRDSLVHTCPGGYEERQHWEADGTYAEGPNVLKCAPKTPYINSNPHSPYCVMRFIVGFGVYVPWTEAPMSRWDCMPLETKPPVVLTRQRSTVAEVHMLEPWVCYPVP